MILFFIMILKIKWVWFIHIKCINNACLNELINKLKLNWKFENGKQHEMCNEELIFPLGITWLLDCVSFAVQFKLLSHWDVVLLGLIFVSNIIFDFVASCPMACLGPLVGFYIDRAIAVWVQGPGVNFLKIVLNYCARSPNYLTAFTGEEVKRLKKTNFHRHLWFS